MKIIKNNFMSAFKFNIYCLIKGYSGADMTNLCREAALGPIRTLDVSSIETIDIEQVSE